LSTLVGVPQEPDIPIAMEQGHDYRFDVFPVFEIDPSLDPPTLAAFRGTAFLACDYLLVTWWHCVREVGKLMSSASERLYRVPTSGGRSGLSVSAKTQTGPT
jgi:hypothetical protein